MYAHVWEVHTYVSLTLVLLPVLLRQVFFHSRGPGNDEA